MQRPPQSPGATSPGLAAFPPAYFALVMATGIVSIAASLLGIPFVPKALFGLNLLFYPLLWAVTIVRAVRYRERVVADLSHHGRSVGFFTVVAATCVEKTIPAVIKEAAAQPTLIML